MASSETLPGRLPAERNIDPASVERFLTEHRHEGPAVSEFQGLRPEEQLTRDQHRVDHLREVFRTKPDQDENHERYAAMLEVVLAEFGNSWLPGYISTASAFDDYVNKTDLVLEMRGENDRILRLAIDVTTSPSATRTKITDIVRDLRESRFSKLDYFKSQLDDTYEQKEVPRVVVGSDDEGQVTQLIGLCIKSRNDPDPIQRNAARHAITEHPVGQQIAAQIRYELSRMADILKSPNTPGQDRARKIAAVQALLSEIEHFNTKKAAQAYSAARGRNGVLATIFKMLAPA